MALWQEVARRTVPLGPHRRPSVMASTKSQPIPEPVADKAAPLAAFRLGEASTPREARHDVLPGITERVASAPVAMDRKSFQRLRRGKLTPEAKLDLHGMTLDQAHGALNGFVMRAHGAGKRLVLVVTGKGKDRDSGGPIPVRHGVLRHNVPQWLCLPPLAPLVLQVTEAHISHGGGGAYYVYLRRQRK
ncbi:Smr/MutS family protein [Roseovarius sp. MBR-78]|jgi:DNA-nicking Smr family endonuclease|uniref:Smr/MutS family protein n=1 Tax=Roseovarius sp. MBR-78 TaxID=3156460 RepID=UPI00339253BD